VDKLIIPDGCRSDVFIHVGSNSQLTVLEGAISGTLELDITDPAGATPILEWTNPHDMTTMTLTKT
jgi:hypothetical protein